MRITHLIHNALRCWIKGFQNKHHRCTKMNYQSQI